jgi:hypothetical protein
MRAVIGALVLGFVAGCSSSSAATGGKADAGTGGTGGAGGRGGASAGGIGGAATSTGGTGGQLDASICPAGGCHPFTSSYPGDAWQAETHVAVGTNGYLAAVWIASDKPEADPAMVRHLDYAFSPDSGATWAPVHVIRAPTADHNASDPAIAVDANNNFYLSFDTYEASAGQVDAAWVVDRHVYVAKAPVGTTEFGAASEVTDPTEVMSGDGGTVPYGYDKPWIAVTRSQVLRGAPNGTGAAFPLHVPWHWAGRTGATSGAGSA